MPDPAPDVQLTTRFRTCAALVLFPAFYCIAGCIVMGMLPLGWWRVATLIAGNFCSNASAAAHRMNHSTRSLPVDSHARMAYNWAMAGVYSASIAECITLYAGMLVGDNVTLLRELDLHRLVGWTIASASPVAWYGGYTSGWFSVAMAACAIQLVDLPVPPWYTERCGDTHPVTAFTDVLALASAVRDINMMQWLIYSTTHTL
jgi:hypothetical protein